MRHAIAALALLSLPAISEWRTSNSTVTMTETPDGAAIRFQNSSADSTKQETVVLTAGGVTVEVHIDVGMGGRPDLITVDAPEGFVAIPRTLEIPDGTSGVINIIPLDLDMS